MNLVLIAFIGVLSSAALGLMFLGGSAVGLSDHTGDRSRIDEVRLRAIDSVREVHELTRDAFTRITEADERKRSCDV